MYDAILVPTDGSEQSEEAADHAIEVARRFGSSVHALHVIDDRGSGRSASSRGAPTSVRRWNDAIAERAREAGLDAESEVLSGDPADVITDYAEERGIDLVVLGARGRSAVGKSLLGDVRKSRTRFSSQSERYAFR